jgi:hypothetical protein
MGASIIDGSMFDGSAKNDLMARAQRLAAASDQFVGEAASSTGTRSGCPPSSGGSGYGLWTRRRQMSVAARLPRPPSAG